MADPGTRRQWVLAVLDRYEGSLLRYAAGLLGDADSAREAVQHAFLQLCEQNSEKLCGCEPAWLFRVCRNKAIDLIRLRQRQTGDSEADLAGLLGREPDPAEFAERQDLCGELTRQVAQLSAGQREAVDLWSEGFSYRQISEIAGTSEGNVRVLVHRAIKQLREKMKVTV
jgi:RNA polymerase sigma factor (sigma-70 family)